MKIKLYHWLWANKKPCENAIFLGLVPTYKFYRSCGFDGKIKKENVIPTFEVDLNDLFEITKNFDLMLLERDGELIGFFDDKGRRFKQR